MINKTINGDRPETVFVVFKNGESSSSIPAGTPVCLVLNTTDDGIACVLPATGAGSKATTLLFGVAKEAVAASTYGKAQVYGFSTANILTRATRAASSDSWTSSASLAVGNILNVDTINNAWLISGTAGVAAALPGAALAETVASMAASATATSDTRTVITTSVKTFLRIL